jgi:hypothetical protein
MPPTPQTLFGLFGDPTGLWPNDAVRDQTGYSVSGDPPDLSAWLGALNNSVQVQNVRTGADANRVSVEAELTVGLGTGFLGYPQGLPFVLVSIPDVEFRIQPYAQTGRSTKLFASVGDDGCELVLEGLPVEIRLPPGLIAPHPDLEGDPSGELVVEAGEFEPGRLDDLKVIYRRIEPTSIFVHVRLYMSEAYEFDIQPAVPISFGACGLSRIPCRTVHDFRLIPSHELAYQPVPSDDPRPGHFEWLRHGIEPWLPSHAGAHDGLFSVRSVDVDENAEGVKDAVEWLNGHSTDKEPTADFVLGDAVVPFLGPFWLPVPRHLTVGVRRKVLEPASRDDVFAFEKAPVDIQISKDPALAIIVESFYYRSQPAPENWHDDVGLTFSAALVFGEDEAPQRAIEIGLEEDLTPTVGYKVDQPALFHFEIAAAVIVDVMAVRAGFSIGRKLDDKSFKDCALLTADLFVSMPPTGSDRSTFRLRGLNGEKVAFAMEGIGWRLGSFNKEGLALPDGVVAYVSNLAFIFSEVGLVAEDGASYLSFSGGLMIELPSGLAGGVTVKRLRFWMSGDPSRPGVKVDGFFLLAHNSDNSVLIEAGGYYSEDPQTREFGFTGSIAWKAGTKTYKLGADLLIGDRRDDDGEFDYFMAQAYFRATIGPLGGWEFTGARLLYARNMLPKLAPVDRESRDLRYYRWYKEQNDPLTVPGDRRLASWRPERESWSFGVGASGSLPAFGKVVEVSLFLLGIKGPSEKGLLVAGELFAFQNTRALGYLVLEVDKRNDRTSAVLGVDARASAFVKDAPAWMDGVGKFTGTLFLSNDPDTLAVGRLADQHTWLTLRFDVDLWLKASLVIGICLELVEDGPHGFALTVRVEGGIGKKGVVRLTYNAGWTLMVETFTSGSSDYAAVISIDAGIRFVLFGFLRVGVSARMEFRAVGAHPSRSELTAELRLETPWFLPDVTWRLDCQSGQLAPERLEAAAPPMRSAGAVEPGTLRQLPAHTERFDPSWNGEGVAPVHSVAGLQAPARPEAERLANLESDATLRPVATDATIGVTWSVAVNDKLGLGGGVASGLGDQRSGDLALRYDLVGIAVRRRPRFGPDRTWQPLEEILELGPDFSDPGGVQLNGSFGPQVLNKVWDVDVQIAGQPAPKKLLVNGVAPYEFTTANPEADEQIVRGEARWPCCPPFAKDLPGLFHHVTWRAVAAGVDLQAPAAWRFTDSLSTLRFLRPAWSHAAGYGGLAPDTMVAAADLGPPGVVARADLDQDAAFCRVRMAWPRTVHVTLVAFDGAGGEVRRLDLGGGSAGHQMVMLAASGPIRRLELRAGYPQQGAVPAAAATTPVGTLIEVDEVAYVGLRDYLDVLTGVAACDGGVPGGAGGFDGSGKLAFLPNHEYELTLTTRVTIAHPSTPEATADVDEFVYFRTKGLPGLNAVARTGDELEPYVRGAYAGGRAGFVYREEPVTLAFSEGFHVAVPLSVRPPGSAAEHEVLLTMQLLVTPEVAAGADTVFTVTADDWIATHHGAGTPPPPDRGVFPWFPVRALARTGPTGMRSTDPLRQRLATMTQRPGATCGLADPRDVTGTVLVAPPQGGGPNPDGSGELWAASARFAASVRVEGAAFVDRRPFVAGDETSLSRSGGTWTVEQGAVHVSGSGPAVALFGEPDWDHMTVVVGIAAPADGAASSAGVGFGLAAADTASRGLFAFVETPAGGEPRLVVRRRDTTGGQLTEVDATGLAAGADPIALTVTAFDDRLRASVGEAVVEVDRGEIRAGRLCLAADGDATFQSLQVRGLTLYTFPFAVSRFRSFAEHIASWSGRPDEIAPNALGPGTTTSTVAALWSATAAAVTAAMAPDAASADRERVFATWVAGLGLPLKDDVTQFELSRLVDGAQTRALLIESPEPLDFSEEVELTLIHREHVGPPPPGGVLPPLGPVIAPHLTLPEALARVPLSPPHAGPGPTGPGHPGPIHPGPGLPPIDEAILDAEMLGDDIRLRLHPAFAGGGTLSVVLVAPEPPRRLYRGPVIPPLVAGKPATMRAEPLGPLPHPPPGSELPAALGGAEPGTVLLVTNDLVRVLGRGRLQPADVDVEVPVQVLQNGDGRRALIIPLAGSAATALSPGSHRLTFRLTRRRWQTTDPEDDLNTYAREATIALDL